MRGRRGSAEAPQYQVVVRVMPCVPACHVLEQTTVCAQDVVGPGAHLPAAPVHGPRSAVLQPRLVLWEEVSAHVLQYLLRHGRCNPLIPLPVLWRVQVSVEIADHQQRGPPGPLADGREDVLYFRGVIWGQVAPYNKPPPVARRQLKADDVRSVGLERLHGEVLRRSVEYGDAAAVRARRLCCHHPLSTRLLRINPFCDLSLLENSQVHVRLGHSAQGIFQSPVPTVPGVVRSETDRMYRLLSVAPTYPRRTARTPTHTRLT